ncbi:hypothetical protein [Shewanella sp.]|uniref:hypothetical protein n=1 Tax=Shewanella sp. TaxID=50422 RepID=UPI004048232B
MFTLKGGEISIFNLFPVWGRLRLNKELIETYFVYFIAHSAKYNMKLIITLTCVMTQLGPAIFPLYYDLVLIPFVLLFFIRSEIKNHFIMYLGVFLLLAGTVIFINFLRYLGFSEWNMPKVYADIRPFILIFLAFELIKIWDIRKSFTLFIFVPVLINFLVNFLSVYFNIYSNFSEIWHQPYIVGGYELSLGKATTVAYAASLQGRFSGVFLQPVVSGVFHAFTLFYITLAFQKRIITLTTFCVLSLCCVFSGVASGSTVFYFSFILFLMYYASGYMHIKFMAFLLLPIALSVILMNGETFLEIFNTTVTSGRFGADSNLARMLSAVDLDIFDLLLGFNLTSMGYFDKGGGDSGYVIKIVNGGLIYMIAYFILLIRYLNRTANIINIRSRKFNRVFAAFIVFMFLVEIGSTGFSLPQVSLFTYTQLFLVLHIFAYKDIVAQKLPVGNKQFQ